MTNTHRPGQLRRRTVLAVMACGAAPLLGCGGSGGGGDGGIAPAGPGASVAGISSGGTGSFTAGTVTGLGSIILRGIRFDDSSATIERDDDGAVGALLPGMVVAVRGSSIAAASGANALPTATATRIRYASEWVGNVEAVDALGRTLSLLGQTVDVPASAVFDGDALQLTAVTTSQYVEVHGYLNLSTGRLLATRVEVSNRTPVALRLSGKVSALDTAARTFKIGNAVIGYDAALALPQGWANGQIVRVTLAISQAAGAWRATAIRQRISLLPQMQVQDQFEAEIEGSVTDIAGAVFSVNGVPVDATGVAINGALAVGAEVEVHGSAFNGVIKAASVQIRSRAEIESEDFSFIGAVSNLDIAARTFTLKGLHFTYTAATRIDVPGWLTGATPVVRVRARQAGGTWVPSEIRNP